jgi:glycosyltransferase involved in cell wall biosynthesis
MYLSASLLTYNGAAYIKKQLDSMLRQTKKIDEIVICDDGSTDDTIQIIKAYQAQYPGIIHLYQNEKQLGSTKNMEQCLGLTSGDLVFLADQDDIWLPNKVARLCTFFEAHPNAEAVFSNAELINEADILMPNLHLWDIIGFPQKNLPTNLDFFDFLSRVDNIVTGAGLAIKNVKQLLTTPFPNVQGLLHDGWIALYYSSKGRLSYCDEILFQYRIHPAQQMGGNIADPNGLLKMNLDLFESRMDTSSFVKTKAYWNRMEQNLRVQNALKSNYQTLDIDHIALINKMDLQINKFYKVGASIYPLRAKLRTIKKAMGF